MIRESASVRIDLLGGTLDLRPINLILENAVTLNAALDLKASVQLEEGPEGDLLLESADYNKRISLKTEDLGPFKFQALILDYFGIKSGVNITLASDSPPGAGLGGSSAMGVALYKALCTYTGRPFDPISAVDTLNAIEGTVLEAGPAGYQDYYPALHGGILALRPTFDGVMPTQLYSDRLGGILEECLTLVYSGRGHSSGVTNWEVYKRFFDGDPSVRLGLEEIARLSSQALAALEVGRPEEIPELIGREGEARHRLFPPLLTPEVNALFEVLKKKSPGLGLKVCGAGGGGCFLLVHAPGDRALVEEAIVAHHMKPLDFKVAPPINILNP